MAGVAKQGGNYFRAVDPNTKPSVPAGTTVEQGKLETSNTGTAESAVRLVSIMRQFEMLQKAVLIGNDMSKQAIEQVAKVGS
jgi:flagellar basal-body rod protein FlgG